MDHHRYGRDEIYKLPSDPGVYKFFSNTGTILYVGKAKNLRKRVTSYFTKQNTSNRKTTKLVKEIGYVEVTIVNSEFDALLLENNLIKENQPKYNILLKDDKSFPSILLTKERFPRIYSTRRINKEWGKYYGPYTSVKSMNNVIDLLHKLYKIRTCNYNLSERNILNRKFKVCLEYHIGNCLGPCEGLQSEEDYMTEIEQAEQILKGKIHVINQKFMEEMNLASTEMNFELAHDIKNKLDYLDKFQAKTLIVNPSITNKDVITIISEENIHYVNFMKVEDGTIKSSETVEVKAPMGQSQSQIIAYSLPILKEKYQSTNTEILCNVHVDHELENVEFIIPKIGDKRKLVDLSVRNALLFKKDKISKKAEKKDQNWRIIERLQSDLRLQKPPIRIECFDNSNIQGTNPVASMVSFKNARPNKREYRKFNIKTVEGPDDFASMKEIVGRRYFRLQKENLPMPDLIVIDGGKGQLNAACEALIELGLYGSIPIIGIAKRLEEIYYPDDPLPLHISKRSESLKVLQHIRDEAHRFAITFHRQKRAQSAHTSELDNIPGVGTSTRQKLWEKFKTVNRIANASQQDLELVIGKSKAQLIINHFNKKGR